jgi:hypothetical protein
MSDLIDFVLDAHGGAAGWERGSRVSATVRVHGDFWAFKGQPDLLSVESIQEDVHQQRIRMIPFGEGRSIEFDSTSDQVTTTEKSGWAIDELVHPHATMDGYTGDTKCSATQTGYFIAYATWMYLLEPCLFILPGIPTRVIEPWHEVGVAWRRLEVTLPNNNRQSQHGPDFTTSTLIPDYSDGWTTRLTSTATHWWPTTPASTATT